MGIKGVVGAPNEVFSENQKNINLVAQHLVELLLIAADLENGNLDILADNVHIMQALHARLAQINAVAADLTNVNTVATNIADVNTTAANITDVNTVADNIADIWTTVANMTDINTVSSNITNVNVTATNISSVNTVSTNITDVNTLAAVATAITALVPQSVNIQTLANELTTLHYLEDNMATVYALASTVEALLADAAHMAELVVVANNITAIDTLVAAMPTVMTVFNNLGDVNTLATNMADINSVAPNIAAVVNVSDNLSAILGAVASAANSVTVANSHRLAAASSAAAAANSAGASANSASASETSNLEAAASLKELRELYYGKSASHPTTDPYGGAIEVGDLYFNSTYSELMVWALVDGSPEWKFAGSGPKGDRGADFGIDAAGTLAQRAAHDDAPEHFTYFATDQLDASYGEPFEQTFEHDVAGARYPVDAENPSIWDGHSVYALSQPIGGAKAIMLTLNGVTQSPSSYLVSEPSPGEFTVTVDTEEGDTLTVREFAPAFVYGAVFFKLSNNTADWSIAIPFTQGVQ